MADTTKKTVDPDPRNTNPESKREQKLNKDLFWIFEVLLPKILNYFVMVLSLGLLAFISWATIRDFDYLSNTRYMHYQLIVCAVFLFEYLYRFVISRHKLRFLFWAFPFLLISIPYLNIIEYYGIMVDDEVLTYLRLVPVIRGLFALVMVVNYATKRLSTTVFMSYLLVLVPLVYMASLIFYTAEKHINEGVKNFWYALWWGGMNVTTIGCDINPVTPTGMIIGFLLSLLGIVMLPLFTVYLGDAIGSYTKKFASKQ